MINPEDILLKTYPEPKTSGMMVGVRNQGIEIFHIPTKIGVIVDSERSQHLNKEKALAMLEILIDLEGFNCTNCWDTGYVDNPNYKTDRDSVSLVCDKCDEGKD